MAEPLVFYVCAKCKRKTLAFHMVSEGRIICIPCDHERKKFIENYKEPDAPG